jgi:para-aminobenzoate synthetase component 2
MTPTRRPTVLFIDHDDSFTYNLVHLLHQAGGTVVTQRAQGLNLEVPYDGYVLGPGHGRPEEAAETLAQLHTQAPDRPILGVCLGHQAIALWAGGQVVQSLSPKHGEREAIEHTNARLFSGVPSRFYSARYNSLTVCPRSLPPTLEVLATSIAGEVMSVGHRSLPIQGIQFHPESVLSDFGCQIFQNWLEDM